ncbi:MAG: sodium:calcium antiporter [Syntrophales bacterium]|jgi:cation:H+ antiporter|nr:sodium:calcium antiporter [Syntrophales bacterium]MCK9528870.1 sodium:calcium antiporter [Syntrophales bacterium]MDX9921156.1 sodium:calcium antiporter [Syntrophales bacterium]
MNILRYLYDAEYLSAALGDAHVAVLIVITLAGIIVLSKGADWMIDGVVSLALKTRIPTIVIGATILSLGTTTPEASVSVMAAWMGDGGLALGNAVGSIIADTGLIFGLTCIFAVTPADRFILNRTGWVQVGTATLLVVFALASWYRSPAEPTLYRWVGVIFLVMLMAYMALSVHWARRSSAVIPAGGGTEPLKTMDTPRSWILIIPGLVLVLAGARVLIPCATETAFRVGVPNDVIAATMVALGTSLPELMTAIAAVRKGHPEITVGNIVGADVLNCLFVIGASAAVSPLSIPPTFFIFHFPAMLVILYSFRFFIFMNRDGTFKRWQGIWLLSIYLVYVTLQYAFNLGGP